MICGRAKTLNRDFELELGKVVYHAACHLRAQKSRESRALGCWRAIAVTQRSASSSVVPPLTARGA